MDSFELNKIAGAILGAGLMIMLINEIGNFLVHPETDVSVLGIETEGAEIAVATTSDEVAQPLAMVLAVGDPAKGAKTARKCVACHSFEQGGANKIGPALYGVIGSPKGAADGFGYSNALTEMGGAWSYEDLYAFLTKPKAFMPGTKMAFAGLRKPSDVADIIAYLREQHDAPPQLPTQ